MEEMTSVSILECIPTKWFRPVSVLIRLYHKVFGNGKMSDGSHFAIAFVSFTGEHMVLDASSKTVRLVNATDFLGRYRVVRTTLVEVSYELIDIVSWYEKLLGESYGYMQYLGIMTKNVALGSGIICNELVLRFLNRFTTHITEQIDIKDLNKTREILSNI